MERQSKSSYWRKLDNAAILYSASSNRKDTRVFRFYCELKEEIQQKILQEALDLTLKRYPVFLSVMRKGLFWHYLEKTDLRPVVVEEYREPCSVIYIPDKEKLLFEVTYYKNRISFDVFHALTDGTGATEFLRELVKNYLVIRHQEENLPDLPLTEKHITIQDQEQNGFSQYYTRDQKRPRKKKDKSFQIKLNTPEGKKLLITEGTVSVQTLLSKCRELKVSMTVLLSAVFLCAIHQEMSRLQERKPVVLMIPVNLRKFFPSASMLNFFGWIEPGYDFSKNSPDFHQVLEHTKNFFAKELTQENMTAHMAEYISLEKHPILRLAPLNLKNLCISAGVWRTSNDVTAILSNMGAVKMPESYVPYIHRFGVFTNTPKMELCVCSFEDTLSLGFTSRFDTTNIKRNFFQILSDLGIEPVIQEPMYPPAPKEEQTIKKFYQWFTFCCILAVVMAIGLNTFILPHKKWSLICAGGVGSLWIALFTGFYKRHNLLKNAIWQLVLITSVCILWDYFTGWKGWSLNYMLPGFSVFIMLWMFLITRIRTLKPKQYMIYFVMGSIFGLVIPLILILSHSLYVIFPCVLSICFHFLVLAALVIFRGQELKEEMHKKLHV